MKRSPLTEKVSKPRTIVAALWNEDENELGHDSSAS